MPRRLRPTATVLMTLAFVAGMVFGATPVAAAPKAGPCALLTTDDLAAALASTFEPGTSYEAGTGITCGYEGSGAVRGATVRVARGKEAKLAMARTMKALRSTLRDIGSEPPSKVAGLGDKAYYGLDEFLGEGYLQVLDGKTFIQVTAIVVANGDTATVSEATLRALAEQALAASK